MSKFNQNKIDRILILYRKNLVSIKKYLKWATKRPNIKVLNMSMAKSGTNMIEQILNTSPALRMQLGKSLVYEGEESINDAIKRLKSIKDGTYLSAHLPYRLDFINAINSLGIKCLVTIRDPRAVFCSLYNYLEFMDHTHKASKILRSIESKDEKVRVLIDGYKEDIQPFRNILEDYLGWLNDPSVCVIRFEDMVGHIGGGDEDSRIMQIKRICNFLNVNEDFFVDTELINPSKSSTFRAPSIDPWKKFLSDKQLIYLNKNIGSLLSDFGYLR